MPPADLAQWLESGALKMNMHPGQQRAWASSARFVAVTAGTQGGKTSFGPYWLLREMFRRGPGDALVVTPTYPLLELKLLGEFRRLFETGLRLGRYTGSPAHRFQFSEQGMRRLYHSRYDPRRDRCSRVIFGYAAEPQSLESATAVVAWCDEAGQKKFKLEAWQAILRRLSLAQGRVLITTSLYALNWLKRKFDAWQGGDGDWEFISFDSQLNPAFPRDEFERARLELPRWKFEMLYRGRFARPAGLIYDCFDAQTMQVPRFAIPRDWKRFIGLDFGEANMAAVFLAEEPATHRLYLYRTYHAGGQSVPGHVRALLRGEPGIAYCAGGSQSENEWRGEFRAAGLPVRAPRLADVEVGIDRMYGCLQRGEFLMFDDLDEFREELTTYSRVLDHAGQPTEAIEDRHAYHLLDAARYIIGDLRGGTTQKAQTARVDFYA